MNYQFIGSLFDNNYVHVLSSDEINKDDQDKPIKTSLSFDWVFWSIWSVFDRYDVLSPINLLIEDDQWRRIWIDPETGRIVNEIPGAWTSWDTEGSWEPEFFWYLECEHELQIIRLRLIERGIESII